MCSVIACVIKQHMPTLCENNITKKRDDSDKLKLDSVEEDL